MCDYLCVSWILRGNYWVYVMGIYSNFISILNFTIPLAPVLNPNQLYGWMQRSCHFIADEAYWSNWVSRQVNPDRNRIRGQIVRRGIPIKPISWYQSSCRIPIKGNGGWVHDLIREEYCLGAWTKNHRQSYYRKSIWKQNFKNFLKLQASKSPWKTPYAI